MLQVVIPMAGLGSRFSEYGFMKNKYLLPINTKLESMIEHAIISLQVNVPCVYIYVIREDHGTDTNLRTILHTISTKHNLTYKISSVSSLTEGPASTVYTAKKEIDPLLPLIVSNSDQVLDWDFVAFYSECLKYNGCVLTYSPNYPLILGSNDKHSFLRLDEHGTVVQCAEKIVLSEKALVGVHYFQTAKHFFDAYEYMLANDIRAPNKEFYLSLAYQAMLEMDQTVGYHDICGTFYPVGEPNDYFSYLHQNGGYKTKIEKLSNLYTLFKNEKVQIVYEEYDSGFMIKNKGFVLIIEGEGRANHQDIVKDNITDLDVHTTTMCSIVHIHLLAEYTYPRNNIWCVSDFTRGWFIGDFMPSILKTSDFEIARMTHAKGEKWPFHYHSNSDEYNVLLQGAMNLNGASIIANTAFTIYKNEIASPLFLEDCEILCIKHPSCPADKHTV